MATEHLTAEELTLACECCGGEAELVYRAEGQPAYALCRHCEECCEIDQDGNRVHDPD